MNESFKNEAEIECHESRAGDHGVLREKACATYVRKIQAILQRPGPSSSKKTPNSLDFGASAHQDVTMAANDAENAAWRVLVPPSVVNCAVVPLPCLGGILKSTRARPRLLLALQFRSIECVGWILSSCTVNYAVQLLDGCSLPCMVGLGEGKCIPQVDRDLHNSSTLITVWAIASGMSSGRSCPTQ